MYLNKLSSKHIKQYQNLLAQRGASEATIKRNLSSLRKFSSWLASQGYLKKDPLAPKKRLFPQLLYRPRMAFQAQRALPYFTYLNFIILAVFLTALGWGLYQQFVVRAPGGLAYPEEGVGPKRYLSFQGRLTDSGYTPITTAVTTRFYLYNSAGTGHPPTGGTLLWDSGDCSVDPDQDGIFAILLGTNSGDGYTCSSALEIDSSVFSENAEVWLHIKVGSEDLDPRIQIATVAYALNAETLQGFPLASAGNITPEATMGATARTVPAINPAGNLVIASDSPTIWSTSGTFGIKGQAITIQTDTGTGGNITLAPDGTGIVNIVPTSGNQIGGTVNATNSALTTGALYTGRVQNDNTDFDFLRFFGGVSPAEKFSVGALGSVYMANNLDVGGAATITGTLAANGSIISNLIPSGSRNLGSSGSNWDYLYVNNIDAFTLRGAVTGNNQTITGLEQLTVNNLRLDGNTLDSTSGNLTLLSAGELYFDDTRTGAIPFSASDTALNAALGQAIIDAINDVYDAATGAGGSSAFWTKTTGLLFPNNTYESIVVGGTSTASAKLYFEGTTGNASMSGNLTLAGGGTIAATDMNNLTIGDANTNNIQFYSGSYYLNPSGQLTLSTEETINGLDIAAGAITDLTGLTFDGSARIITNANQLTLSTSGASSDLIFSAGRDITFDDDNLSSPVALSVSASGLNMALTQGIIDAINEAYDAATGAGGSSAFWTKTSGLLFPNNAYESIAVGGSATTSAKLYFEGTTGNASISGDLTFAGGGTIAATDMGNLTVGNTATQNVIINPKTQIQLQPITDTTTFFQVLDSDGGTPILNIDATNERVGIGTSSPAYTLHLAGSQSDYLGYIYNSSTNAAAAGLYIRVDGDGNLLTLNAGGNDIVTISEAQSVFNNPTSFTSAGDVSIAYDLIFTNQTASYIKSNAPLYLEAGESFESNDLTLRTYNKGNVIVDSEALVTNYAATVSSQLVVGTNTAPANIGGFYLTNAGTYGKALAVFNQTEGADILTASASGSTKLTVSNAGNLAIEGQLSDITDSALTINDSLTLTGNTLTFGQGETIDNVTNGRLTFTGDTFTTGTAYFANGTTYYIDASGHASLNNITGAGTLDINGGGTHDIAGTLNLSGNALTSTGDLTITPGGGDVLLIGNFLPSSGDTYDLGSTTAYWNNLYVNNIYGSSGGTQGFWTKTTGLIYPNNAYESVAVGGTSTASAKLYFEGTTGNASMSGNLALAGGGTIGATDMNNLTIGDASTGNIQFYSSSNTLTPSGHLNLAGNVGIGGTAISSTVRLGIHTTNGTEILFDTNYEANITAVNHMYIKAGSAKSLYFGSNNVDAQMALNSGNLGIGTISPGAKLDVAGDATLSGTLSLAPQTEAYAGTCDPAAAGKIYYDASASKYYYCNGSSWTEMGAGSAALWESGTYGTYEVDAAVIVGADAAFSWADGGVGDLKVADQLEVTGDASISGTLTIGQGETIRPAYGPLQFAYKSGPDAWTTGMTINESGNVGIEGSLYDISQAALTIDDSLTLTGNTLTFGQGETIDNVTNGRLTFTGDIFTTGTAYFANGTTYYIDSSGHANLNNITGAGTLDINGGGTHDIAGTLNLSGNALTSSGDLTITPAGGDLLLTGNFLPASGDTYDLGATTAYWNNLYVNNIYGGASGTQGFWTKTSGLIYPNNTYESVAIGGTATTSAKLYFEGTTGNASMSGNLTLAGGGTIAVTDMNNLTLGDSSTQNLIINPNGNVGIGTTGPSAKLHIVGSADTQQLIVKGNATQTSNLQEWQNSVGAVRASIDVSGNTFVERLGVSTAPTTNSGINVFFQSSDTAAGVFGISGIMQYGAGSADNTSKLLIGAKNEARTAITYTGAITGTLIGGNFISDHYGTGLVSNMVGGRFQMKLSNDGTSGTATNAKAIDIQSPVLDDASSTIDNLYGVYIADQALGDVLNYAIYTNAGDVLLNAGSDANTDFQVNASGVTGALFIDGTQGNVGIGNTAPALSLEVGDITLGVDAANGVGIQGDLEVEDFALLGALRVGSTGTDPLPGNLYTEGDVTVAGGDITGTGDEKIDIGEETANTIQMFIDAVSELTLTATLLQPSANAGLSLGQDSNEWNDLWIDGTAYLDAATMHGAIAMGDNNITNAGTIQANTIEDNDDTILAINDNLSVTGNILPSAGSTYDLGAAGTSWANVYTDNLYGGTSGTLGFWTKNNGLLYPNNTYESIAVGGTSTTSAQLYFDGTDGDASMSGKLTLFGASPAITTTNMRSLTLGDASTGNIVIYQDLQVNGNDILDSTSTTRLTLGTTTTVSGNLTVTQNLKVDTNTLFVEASTDRVGIGTTDPQAKLDIAGASSLISNSSGDITLDASSGYISFSSDYISNLGGVYGDLNVTGNILNSTAEQPVKISDWMLVQTSTPSAALMVDQTGDGDIFTASTSGVPKFTITNAGYVGIGTTNPYTSLDIYSSDEAQMVFMNPSTSFWVGADAGGSWLWNYENFDMLFATNDTERMRITGGGNVGIGTTAPGAKLEVSDAAGATDKEIARFINTADSSGAYISIVGDSAGADKAVQLAADGNGALKIATGETTLGTYGTTDFIIMADGKVGIGTTAPNSVLQVTGDEVRIGDSGAIDFAIYGDGNLYVEDRIEVDGGVWFIDAYNNTLSGEVLYVNSNGRLGRTSSSLRYKTNIRPLEDDFSKILQVEPKVFNFINDENNQDVLGYIAEEFDEIGLNNLVVYDQLGRPDAIRYDRISLYLTEVVKDHEQKIHDLEQLTTANELEIAQLNGDFSLDDIGDLKIQQTESSPNLTEYTLRTSSGETINRLGAFAQIAVAQIKAGLIQTQELIANYANVNELRANISELANVRVIEKLVSPVVETDQLTANKVISDQLSATSLEATESKFGKLLVENEQGETVASIDSAGNANFGGLLEATTVTSDQLSVTGDATVAGTLYADHTSTRLLEVDELRVAGEIIGRKATFGDLLAATISAGTIDQAELDEIQARLSELEGKVPASPTPEPTATPTLEPIPTPTESPEASGSGDLDSPDSTDSGEIDDWENWSLSDPSDDILLTSDITITGDLTALGTTSLADTSVAGQLMVDATIIIDRDGIQTLPGSTLKLQAYGWGGIDMLDGKVTIDTQGNVLITGELTAGRINTGGLVLSESANSSECDPNDSECANESGFGPSTSSGFGKLLAVINKEGLEVASIDASGSAFFAQLGIEADYTATQSGAIIAAAQNYYENGYLAPAIKTNATAGIGILPAYEEEVMIYNPQVTGESLIYVTATTNTENKVLYVKAKKAAVSCLPSTVDCQTKPGWFIVAINESLTKDIQFNWWIIGAKPQNANKSQ